MAKALKKEGKSKLSNEQRFDLITRNLQEVIGEDELKTILASGKPISVYWGTMPTGSPHISYLYPFTKIADLLSAGLKVKILLADLHAALDGVPWEKLDKRQAYYKAVIPKMIELAGVNTKNLEFVEGSSYQLKKEYTTDLLKLTMMTNVNDATKSASEVVKLGDNPKLGGLIYPLMQALDEEYLGVDIQFGGTDQRKILVYAREYLPKLGYKARIDLMNYILPGLIGKKMSSSVPGSKIDIMDSEDDVNKKINNAECVEGNIDNGLLPFLKYTLFVIKSNKKEKMTIERPEKYGGNLSYSNYQDLENDFASKKLHPMDLKKAIAKEINKLIEPIRSDPKIKKLHQAAYSN